MRRRPSAVYGARHLDLGSTPAPVQYSHLPVRMQAILPRASLDKEPDCPILPPRQARHGDRQSTPSHSWAR